MTPAEMHAACQQRDAGALTPTDVVGGLVVPGIAAYAAAKHWKRHPWLAGIGAFVLVGHVYSSLRLNA